ncbi:uncharacterized protein YjgD (DUF1641 family) [Bacillus fengqiuensis]|nr:uncharacterized protein YjgD (DUF1641 family) [Bacillus fengqiuensis]
MAKAIRQINKHVPNKEEEQAQAVADIVAALAENREAIVTTLGILKELQEMGALNAIHGLLQKRTDVGAIAIQQINKPNMHNTIKNGMNALGFLGSINPDQLKIIFQGLNQGLERATESAHQGEEQSLWKLGKNMGNSEVKASLATMMGFMQGMGEAFQQENGKLH